MNTQKILITILLVTAFIFLPKYSYPTDGCDTLAAAPSHILSIFSHANIFHLSANILCLWLLKCRLRLPLAIASSFLCSFLPQWSLWGAEQTLGFSGVLFSVVGMTWGVAEKSFPSSLIRMCRINLPPILLTALFPHVNAFIHLYTLLCGYLVGLLLRRLRLCRGLKPKEL